MQAEVSKNPMGGMTATLKPSTTKDPSNYALHRIEIEPAENGVTVHLHHKMTPEAEHKLSNGGKNHIDYDSRHHTERHVFENMKKAGKFIHGRLTGDKDE